MAVFLVNSCKFRGCGVTFGTLAELIQHIEEIHIDSDPRVLERQELQQPASLALSYVLRVFTDAASVTMGKPTASLVTTGGAAIRVNALTRPRPSSVSPSPSLNSVRSSTPTGSEFDEEEGHSDNENSDDSWTTQEEFTSELILSMMTNSKEQDTDKPFVCPVPGCKKRYKNVNGIKYHAKHGHKKEIRVKKPFRCKCGKTYKSASGLRHHSMLHHANGDFTPIPKRCHTQQLTKVAMASVPPSLLQGMQAVAHGLKAAKGTTTTLSLGLQHGGQATLQQLTLPVTQVVTQLLPNNLITMDTPLATESITMDTEIGGSVAAELVPDGELLQDIANESPMA